MLTAKERKNLQALLSHAVKPDEALNVDQLEGYLFGVVITPDVTQPSEWFADIFGEAFASFADEKEANARFVSLMEVYNRLNSLRLQGALRFPFALEHADRKMLDRLRDWSVGLDRALALRSWLWMPDEVLEAPEMADEDEEVLNCLMTVLAVAHPEKIPELFEGVGERGESEEEVWTNLVGQLPLAVEILQMRAGVLEKERPAEPAVRATRPGRNEPCRCGSGKKYKKCCGLN